MSTLSIRWLRGAFAAAVLCLATGAIAAEPADTGGKPLVVFAAASLKESMDEAAATYKTKTRHEVTVSYAGSSALARQIEQGAPADVFISADLDWMDELQQKGLVDTATRTNLLGNTLVLIAPATSKAQAPALKQGANLLPLLGEDGRLALALTASVPAGKYAKASFTSLGMWTALAPRVAEAENVRAALLLVARGEAPLGVVYGSDAKAEPRVRVLATFPADSHPDIVYPVARLEASSNAQATPFVTWLQTSEADAIFRKYGFTVR